MEVGPRILGLQRIFKVVYPQHKAWDTKLTQPISDKPELKPEISDSQSRAIFVNSTASLVWLPNILTRWIICSTRHILRYLCLLKSDLFDKWQIYSYTSCASTTWKFIFFCTCRQMSCHVCVVKNGKLLF